MARRPLPSYDNLTLPTNQAAEEKPETGQPVAAGRAGEGVSLPTPAATRRSNRYAGNTLKERSHHCMVYFTPEYWLAIRRMALETDVKPHDLLIEALQEYADKRGLNVRARVPSRDRDETD